MIISWVQNIFSLYTWTFTTGLQMTHFSRVVLTQKKSRITWLCFGHSIDVALTHVRKKASHFEDDRCSNENMIATTPSRCWCCCCCCCRRTSAVWPWNWEWWCSAALIHPTSLKEIHRWTGTFENTRGGSLIYFSQILG